MANYSSSLIRTINNSLLRTLFFFIFLVAFVEISPTHAITTLYTGTSSGYNLRIDGAEANDRLGWTETTMYDIDRNGKDDLIISAEEGGSSDSLHSQLKCTT